MRYPAAEWVPWEPADPRGRPTFYAGRNRPAAVVLHIMAGYASTARQWATEAHFGASWHYTIARDGHVMQHLEHHDGGYHAGITATQAADHPPSWVLWRGPAESVNRYTVGIEHEGFPGTQFPPAQLAASRALCRWLASTLGIPFERARFPAHAEIDLVNRPNDFNTQPLRGQYYRFLFEEDVMTEEQVRRLLHEELAAFSGDVMDGRLREVMAARESLRRLASEPDATLVERAVALLRQAAIIT